MSTAPDESPEVSRAAERRRIALRVIALLASFSAITALWVGERQKANHDLQLIAQPGVRPGSTVALRALLLTGIESVEGPRLSPRPVEVSLRDGQDAELARTRLLPDALSTMGGELRVPPIAPGRYVLDAVAEAPDGANARCRMAVQVTPKGGGLVPEGRMAGPLQHLSLGRMREVSTGPQPVLDARVVGGACVPERPCQVVVRMGAPGFALEVRPSASAHVQEAPEPAGEVSGLVRTWLVVHGPEAETVLRATRGGELVAERPVRLPVGLGEVALSVQPTVLEPGQPPRYRAELPPGRSSLLLDAYHRGDWRLTAGVEDAAEGQGEARAWPGARELSEGLWQLQARTDPFSSSAAGVRAVFVRAPGMDDASLLRELDQIGAAAGEPPVFEASEPLPTWAFADIQATAAYLVAPREGQRLPQPLAVSGRPVQLQRLSKTRTLLRFSVAAMLVLAALVVSGTMVRRELGAQESTRRALREAGDVTIDTPLSRRRQAFWLWSMALGVALAFVLAALMIVAKPLWF